MSTGAPKLLVVAASSLAVLALAAGVFFPHYLNSYVYLGALIFAFVLGAALWNYQSRLFPLLVLIFLWAGLEFPLAELWTSRRWFVLGIAAAAGAVLYLRDANHHFGRAHLFAMFCVIAAMVSAMVSSFPQQAMLKASSLFLLFLYGSTGARMAIAGREGRFCARLLLACEGLTYVAAFSYFGVRHELFGNPNSLGAIMGVAVVPTLLWGVFVSDTPSLKRRRTVVFTLAMVLLLASYARAGIAAAAISCGLLCLSLRRYATLSKGLALAVVLAFVATALRPLDPGAPPSLIDSYLYKGKQEVGVFASRQSVWEQTVTSIRQRPWFGTGFGTMATSYESTVRQSGTFSSSTRTTREHGSSYLAITEWVGLLGVAPFMLLLSLVVYNVARCLSTLYRTGNPLTPAVPLSAILAAGLIHAAFEDWMFAVGYYLCVFFWSITFMFFDVYPGLGTQRVPEPVPRAAWPHGFEAAPSPH